MKELFEDEPLIREYHNINMTGNNTSRRSYGNIKPPDPDEIPIEMFKLIVKRATDINEHGLP